jgi:hypothetical protein
VSGIKLIPLFIPKSWLTTGFFGAAQQMKVNHPKAGMMKSGNQYQVKEAAKTIMKKEYRDIVHLLL